MTRWRSTSLIASHSNCSGRAWRSSSPALVSFDVLSASTRGDRACMARWRNLRFPAPPDSPRALNGARHGVLKLLDAADPRIEGYLPETGEQGERNAVALIESLRVPVHKVDRRLLSKLRMIAGTRDLLG